jgi:hypothetical protein
MLKGDGASARCSSRTGPGRPETSIGGRQTAGKPVGVTPKGVRDEADRSGFMAGSAAWMTEDPKVRGKPRTDGEGASQ